MPEEPVSQIVAGKSKARRIGCLVVGIAVLILFLINPPFCIGGSANGYPVLEGPSERYGLNRAIQKQNMWLIKLRLYFWPSEVNSSKWSPYINHAIETENFETVHYLLDHGAKLDVEDGSGLTPLMTAMFKVDPKLRVQMITLLIEHGADINKPSSQDLAPLFFAVGCSDPNSIKTLLENDADPALTNSKGQTAVFALPKEKENVSLLLGAGLDINALDDSRLPPIYYFATCCSHVGNNVNAARIFAELGANMKFRDNNGDNLLHRAYSTHAPGELIQLLVDYGVEINEKNNRGKTPLHVAISVALEAFNNNIGPLMNAAPDLTIRDDEGRTPVHYLYLFKGVNKNDLSFFSGHLEACDIRDNLGHVPDEYRTRQDLDYPCPAVTR